MKNEAHYVRSTKISFNVAHLTFFIFFFVFLGFYTVIIVFKVAASSSYLSMKAISFWIGMFKQNYWLMLSLMFCFVA